MTTINHLSLGVADVLAARAFYSRVLDVLGIGFLAEGDGFAAFCCDRVAFLLLSPFDGGPASTGNGAHLAEWTAVVAQTLDPRGEAGARWSPAFRICQ